MKKYVMFILSILISCILVSNVMGMGISISGSNDTDKLNIVKTSIIGKYNPDVLYVKSLGMSITDVRLNQESKNINGVRGGVLTTVSTKNNNTYIDLDVGITTISNHNHFTGDVRLTQKVGIYFNVSLFGIRDFVDNMISVDNGLTYNMIGGDIDFVYDRFFLGTSIGTVFISNDNRRDYIKIKTGLTLIKKYGISIYGSSYDYKNTLPYQGFYFDPETYQRYLVGIQLRKVIGGFLLTGHIDGGIQIVDNEMFNSYSYKIGVKKFILDNLSINFNIGSDHFQPDYRYTNGFLQLTYHF
jgi:hypothetical protein